MTNVTLDELKKNDNPTILGGPTCPKCVALKKAFARNDVAYEYYNLPDYPDLIDEVRVLTGGPISLPVVVYGGRVLLQGQDSSEIASLPRTLKNKDGDDV